MEERRREHKARRSETIKRLRAKVKKQGKEIERWKKKFEASEAAAQETIGELEGNQKSEPAAQETIGRIKRDEEADPGIIEIVAVVVLKEIYQNAMKEAMKGLRRCGPEDRVQSILGLQERPELFGFEEAADVDLLAELVSFSLLKVYLHEI